MTTPKDFKIHVLCNICGKEVVLDRPSTGFPAMDATLMRIAQKIICNDCGDTRNQKYQAQSQAIRLMRLNEKVQALIPAQFQDTTRDRIPNQKAWDKAMAWQYNPRGLILHGGSGRGKSRTAWALLKRECELNRTVVGISHSDFSFLVTHFSSAHEAKQWTEIVCACDLLLIDDLCKAELTKDKDSRARQSEDILWLILEKRWNNNLPNVFTSEFTGDYLKDRFSPEKGTALVRRLREFQDAIHF